MRRSRDVYTVRWAPSMRRWTLTTRYGLLMMDENKVKIIARSRALCRVLKHPTELRIRAQSGRLQARHRYA